MARMAVPRHAVMQAAVNVTEATLSRPLATLVDFLARRHEARWEASLEGKGKCVVGVPCTTLDAALGRFGGTRAYVNAILASNGIPRLMFVGRGTVGEQMQRVDGLLLKGGFDIDPKSYGEERRAGMRFSITVPPFDRFEIAATQMAFAHDVPVLGLCRGMQAMNVSSGGTLYQDLPSEYTAPAHAETRHRTESRSYEPLHDIEVATGSHLGHLLGADRVNVNSVHHQAVERLGQGLRVTATAPDQVVEAIERTDGTFQVGLQCHPEHLLYKQPEFQRVFDALVDHAAARRA